MGKEEINQKSSEKIHLLNTIFDDLIIDASELIRDLYNGVRTYLIFGLMTTLFGVSELVNNMDSLQEKYYIPAFVSACLLFCGLAQIIVYRRLQKKYSKLFEKEMELKAL